MSLANSTTATTDQKETQPASTHSPLEIAWLFVEQYYNTLHKSPEKLHCFYLKTSTICHGLEGEFAETQSGQKDINDRLMQHNFKDCKVMISNVDAQGSCEGGILIQLLGEMSNNGQESKKFTQTFFLARNKNAFFVLNDIFRFLKEDNLEEESQEGQQPDISKPLVQASPEVTKEEPKPRSEPKEETKEKSTEVRKPSVATPVAISVVASAAAEEKTADSTPAVSVPATTVVAPKAKSETTTVEHEEKKSSTERKSPVEKKSPSDKKEEKKSADEKPTPVTPSGPTSWAAIVSINKGPVSGTPVKQTKGTVSSTTSPAAGVSTEAASAAFTPVVKQHQHQSQQQQPHQQQQSQQHQHQQKKSGQDFNNVYIKDVHESIDVKKLQTALSKFGLVTHCDINREKKCGFIDFLDTPSRDAALAAKSLTVNGHVILIEERKRTKRPTQNRYNNGPSGAPINANLSSNTKKANVTVGGNVNIKKNVKA